MLTWEYLSQYNINNSPKKKLLRNKYTENLYVKHIADLDKNNIKLDEFIKNLHFKNNDKKYVIYPNPFPYDVEDNIDHFILWINPSLDINIMQVEINYYINSFFPNKNKIYFENINENKSIPEIKYYHVFVKN